MANEGKCATFLWLGIGGILFFLVPSTTLLSWQAAVYFIVGMFVSALFIGMGVYVIQRIISKVLSKVISSPSNIAAVFVLGIGAVLRCSEAGVVYFISLWSLKTLFG
ncbi:MAG TPA: hypothetical protein QGG18_01410 [Rhodospirillales bacterium]|nr:hypothetical protein [Rhodospirillales bacterium]